MANESTDTDQPKLELTVIQETQLVRLRGMLQWFGRIMLSYGHEGIDAWKDDVRRIKEYAEGTDLSREVYMGEIDLAIESLKERMLSLEGRLGEPGYVSKAESLAKEFYS